MIPQLFQWSNLHSSCTKVVKILASTHKSRSHHAQPWFCWRFWVTWTPVVVSALSTHQPLVVASPPSSSQLDATNKFVVVLPPRPWVTACPVHCHNRAHLIGELLGSAKVLVVQVMAKRVGWCSHRSIAACWPWQRRDGVVGGRYENGSDSFQLIRTIFKYAFHQLGYVSNRKQIRVFLSETNMDSVAHYLSKTNTDSGYPKIQGVRYPQFISLISAHPIYTVL